MTDWEIAGRTALITGGNAGIGLATAEALTGRGANVVLGVRNVEKGRAAAAAIEASTGIHPSVVELDLASLESVRTAASKVAAEHPNLSIVINNAGVFLGRRRITVDGFEATIATNHLGHFLLTCLLEPSLIVNSPSRVITVSSGAHHQARLDVEDLNMKRSYRATRAYANSKLANIMFTRELARRLAGSGVSAFSVHPGLTATRIAQDGDSIFGSVMWKVMRRRLADAAEGADTVIWLATEPGLEDSSGDYFFERRVASPNPSARDDVTCARLWLVSEDLTGCVLQ